MRIAALLVAAGSGSRFGAPTPKQFTLLAGKPAIRWAAEALLPAIDLLQIVGDTAPIAEALKNLTHLPPPPRRRHKAAVGKSKGCNALWHCTILANAEFGAVPGAKRTANSSARHSAKTGIR